MTDAFGNLGYAATYQPFGNTLESYGRAATAFGFTGEYTDASGLLYLRARYAHMDTSTFLSRDPVMGIAGDASVRWNPYVYAGANPVNYIDPDGRFFFMPILLAGAVGAIAGGAINLALQLAANGGRLDCIDKTALGMAMLEGFVTGMIGGAVGALAKSAGLSVKAARYLGEAADFATGTAWDRLVPGMSAEEAFKNQVANLLAGRVLNRAGNHIFGRGHADSAVRRANRDICPNSFSADTTVSTPDGDVPISEIEVGDIVYAYDKTTGEVGEYRVTHTWEHDDDQIVTLTIDGEVIETTPWHPFYTDEGWQDAGDLEVGERVLSLDGDYGIVEAVMVEARTETMYDLTVEQVHTFAVGDGQWITHNRCPVPKARRAAELSSGISIGADDINLVNTYTRLIGGRTRDNKRIASLNPALSFNDLGRSGGGRSHAEQRIYRLLQQPEQTEIGISDPDGPCGAYCDPPFRNRDIVIGFPNQRGGMGSIVNVWYRGVSSVFNLAFSKYA